MQGQESTEMYTETITVRTTPEMKRKLKKIAKRSVSSKLGDHIRFALDSYIEQQERSTYN